MSDRFETAPASVFLSTSHQELSMVAGVARGFCSEKIGSVNEVASHGAINRDRNSAPCGLPFHMLQVGVLQLGDSVNGTILLVHGPAEHGREAGSILSRCCSPQPSPGVFDSCCSTYEWLGLRVLFPQVHAV